MIYLHILLWIFYRGYVYVWDPRYILCIYFIYTYSYKCEYRIYMFIVDMHISQHATLSATVTIKSMKVSVHRLQIVIDEQGTLERN
jgi:hypothetical protein